MLSFGKDNCDTQLPKDNPTSENISLPSAISYFNKKYNSLYVHESGVISFNKPYSGFMSNDFPFKNNETFYAIYLADVDTGDSCGDVWYRVTKDQETLDNIAQLVQGSSSLLDKFQPTWAFIATWNEVCFHQASHVGKQKRNTFQAVLATDGSGEF